ncbi:BsuPI-related putative proteinase inhibitor [Halobacillus sp. BBL2006]|uniref:BsuPI-related putative proteinase inhibitor n=1 Tax=Halobacillus sp. BBL2006 TaxID=1543706 RepID=UPI00068C40AC|nr:BsuPI-related putative proteinase inhibitor [Halobacillus sp. BBL2006]
MKKLWIIMMGIMILALAACGSNSETKEAKGEENADQSETSEESEIDMQSLIDQMKMDATIDTTEDTAKFNFSLENTGDEPVILGFTSSQQYEVKVENSNGESVYTFSANKMFTQELTTEEVASGDSLSATETWTGIEEKGDYKATITFLVDSINDQPLEATPYQVTQSFTIDGNAEKDQTGDESKTYGDGEAFRNVKVSGQNGSYVINGEARVFEGNFMYSVEDGHMVQVEPTSVQVEKGAPEWSKFELKINIPKDKLPDYGTLSLVLFEESAKDGKPTHVNNIPLEQFPSE